MPTEWSVAVWSCSEAQPNDYSRLAKDTAFQKHMSLKHKSFQLYILMEAHAYVEKSAPEILTDYPEEWEKEGSYHLCHPSYTPT